MYDLEKLTPGDADEIARFVVFARLVHQAEAAGVPRDEAQCAIYPDVFESAEDGRGRCILSAGGPPFGILCPTCKRDLREIRGEVPNYVEIAGRWVCTDCYDGDRYPPPVDVARVRLVLPGQIALLRSAFGSDGAEGETVHAVADTAESLFAALHRVGARLQIDEQESARLRKDLIAAREPVPMLLWCPICHARHVDVGVFATKAHHTHACQGCGLTWRPAVRPTVGVQFLPGFKDQEPATVEGGAS